jgi:hypothetical protein
VSFGASIFSIITSFSLRVAFLGEVMESDSEGFSLSLNVLDNSGSFTSSILEDSLDLASYSLFFSSFVLKSSASANASLLIFS